MKTMREQVIERINHLGGESVDFYNDYSDYDILEDYENLLRTLIEEECRAQPEVEQDESID
mgnify:CR=1 FL=1